LLGVLHLIPVFDQALALHHHLLTTGSVRQDLVGIGLSGISQLSISLFLIIMSIGLWLRLRAVWLLSVIAIVSAIINLYLQSDRPLRSELFVLDTVLLGLMLVSNKFFNRTTLTLTSLAALSAVLILLGYNVFGVYHLGDQFSPQIDTFTDAIYLAIVTMSTVGYGDITPATSHARLFIVSVILLSITVFSTALGTTLVPAMIRKIELFTSRRPKKMTRNDHYIIVGDSSLSGNTIRELIDRGKQVTVIMREKPKSSLFSDEDIDIVIGDGSDLETLRKAGAEDAKAILALLDDDSENAFVILAAKELKVKAKTVAAVNNTQHLTRLRNVHPDMIIAPQVLGGELLTSMLTGERIDVEGIMDRILGISKSTSKVSKIK
jgi:voltage-gated potassium channel